MELLATHFADIRDYRKGKGKDGRELRDGFYYAPIYEERAGTKQVSRDA